MPKTETYEYDRDRVNNLLKELYGSSYKPHDQAEPSPPSPQEDEEPGFLTSVARGAAKEGASLLTGTGNLANKAIGLVSPSTRDLLSERASQSPDIQRMQQFGEEPYQNTGEFIGGIGTDIGTGFAIPTGWIGRAATAALGRVLPKTLKVIPTVRWAPKAAPAASEAEPMFAGGGQGFRSSAEAAKPAAEAPSLAPGTRQNPAAPGTTGPGSFVRTPWGTAVVPEISEAGAGAAPEVAEAATAAAERTPRYAGRFKPVFAGKGRGFRPDPKRAYTKKAATSGAAKAAEAVEEEGITEIPPTAHRFGSVPPTLGVRATEWPMDLKFGYRTTMAPSKWAGRLGPTIGRAGAGAAGGALSDQDDPMRGAMYGAAAGLVPRAIHKGVVSPVGRFAVRHLVPNLASMGSYWGLRHLLRFPGMLAHAIAIPNIRWHHSPIGRKLTMIGDRIVDQFGNLVGVIEGAPSGIAAGRVSQGLGTED